MSNKIETQDNTPRNYAGTKDWFGPEVEQRDFVIKTATDVFKSFGYQPLETPIIELENTLKGKYGEEGGQTMYLFSKGGENIGLRYDQTVPLARVAAQHSNELTFPYARYAIGPVFRADKPQAGRYRQFTQIDFDILGVDNTSADAEVVTMLYQISNRLGFKNFTVMVSDRSLLTGMAETVGAKTEDQYKTAMRGWDKLEKVGMDQVAIEIEEADLDRNTYIELTNKLLGLSGSNDDILKSLRDLLGDNESAKKGIERLEQISQATKLMQVPDNKWRITPTLARGLDYYTGPIFEVQAGNGIGSIAGGGRYDNLIEVLGGPSITGTGASFGLERVAAVMNQLEIRPLKKSEVDAFVTVFNSDCLVGSLEVATLLRKAGLSVEVDKSGEKLKKQFQLADRRNAKYALVIGPDELAQGKVTIKYLDQAAGGSKDNQETIKLTDLAEKIKQINS